MRNLKTAVPPHNEEAEIAVLGIMLIDPESIPEIRKFLQPIDFYRGGHQRIYEALLDLVDTGQAVDLITVCDELREKGMLDFSGGAEYIARLTSAVPTSANPVFYAMIVQASSKRRQLIKMAMGIYQMCFDMSVEVKDIEASIEQMRVV